MRHSLVLLTLSVMIACKPSGEQKADNKSIEALMQADQSARNRVMCGDAQAANQTPQDALKRVYEALPIGLKQILDTGGALENKHGGGEAGIENISMQSSVIHLCKNILTEQRKTANVQGDLRLEAIKGCWRGRQVANKALPEIFIKEDIAAIHDGLIPMVVYGVVELYFDRILNEHLANLGDKTKSALSKSEEFLLSFYERFVKAREELALALVADLESQKMTKTLDSYVEIYGSSYKQSTEFRNFVLAELMDSHYCSLDTRKTFDRDKFPKAKAAFEKIIAFFGPSPLWPTVKIEQIVEVPPDLSEEAPPVSETPASGDDAASEGSGPTEG